MKERPTKEQVLDALATHKQLYRAAKSLGVTYPTMQKWMRQYGIAANHNVKVEPEKKEPWYKRFFNHGKESN